MARILAASITQSVFIWHYPCATFFFVWTACFLLIILPTPPCLFPRTFWKWAIMAVVPISAKVEGQPSARCTLYARRRYGRGDWQRLAVEIALKRANSHVDSSRRRYEKMGKEIEWTRKCLSLARDFRDRRRRPRHRRCRDDAGVSKSENKPTR